MLAIQVTPIHVGLMKETKGKYIEGAVLLKVTLQTKPMLGSNSSNHMRRQTMSLDCEILTS